MRKSFISILFMVGLCLMWTSPAIAIQEKKAQPKAKPVVYNVIPPEARQFDFWVGKWRVTGPGTLPFTDTVKIVAGGTALIETWAAPDGSSSGSSINVYDTANKTWTQTYADSNGLFLQLTGKFENGEMILFGKFRNPANNRVQLGRLRFSNITKNGLDQDMEVSDDNGQTWTLFYQTHWTK